MNWLMLPPVGAFLAFLVFAVIEDCRTRRIPSELVWTAMGLGVISWAFGWWEISPLGAALGWSLAVLGRLPQGDRQAAGVVGFYLGALGAAGALGIAYGGLLLAFWGHRHDLIGWPGGWPFFPFLGTGACGMLLVALLTDL